MATDTRNTVGKGPRAHRNVSNKAYRDGWQRVFGNREELPLESKTINPFARWLREYGEQSKRR